MDFPIKPSVIERHGGIDAPRRNALGPRILPLLAALVVTGLPGGGGRIDRKVAAHAASRFPEIAGALERADADSILLAGNSHAEIAGAVDPACTGGLANAGVGGVRAEEYRAILVRLPRTKRMREAVLLVGTNDILRRGKPLSALSRLHFTAAAAGLLAELAGRADRITVAAVPPIGPEAVRRRDPAAVAVYSEILRGLCRGPACRFVDPFAALRSERAGIARPGALPDAIHLADYPGMLAALDACPAGGGAVPEDGRPSGQGAAHRAPGSAVSASGVAR